MPLKLGGAGRGRHRRLVRLRADSPLRRVDARLKLALCLLLTPAIMLPWPRVLLFAAGLLALLGYARLLGEAAHQVRRAAWLLVIVLVADWIFIGAQFAVLIAVRMVLLVTLTSLLMGTTTPEELREGLRGLGLPYRYAFVLSLSFLALPLMLDEWRAIQEAQIARGALPAWRAPRNLYSLRRLPAAVRDGVALAVPAVALTARRAWSLTEAAHARGLDSPYKPPIAPLPRAWRDWALVVVSLGATLALALVP